MARIRAWTRCVSSVAEGGPQHPPLPWPRPVSITCQASYRGSDATSPWFPEGIGLSTDATVSEGSGENIFLVNDGVFADAGTFALGTAGGLTRDTIIRLAKDAASKVRECAFARELLYLPDEAFLSPHRGVSHGILSVGPHSRRRRQAWGRSRKTLQTPSSVLFHVKTADKWGWLDHVDMACREASRRRPAGVHLRPLWGFALADRSVACALRPLRLTEHSMVTRTANNVRKRAGPPPCHADSARYAPLSSIAICT